MSEVIHVVVTSDDTVNGITGDTESCPVAIALGRAIGADVRVYGTQDQNGFNALRGSWGRHEGGFKFPRGVAARIKAFDRTGNMRPFEFDATFISRGA